MKKYIAITILSLCVAVLSLALGHSNISLQEEDSSHQALSSDNYELDPGGLGGNVDLIPPVNLMPPEIHKGG